MILETREANPCMQFRHVHLTGSPRAPAGSPKHSSPELVMTITCSFLTLPLSWVFPISYTPSVQYSIFFLLSLCSFRTGQAISLDISIWENEVMLMVWWVFLWSYIPALAPPACWGTSGKFLCASSPWFLKGWTHRADVRIKGETRVQVHTPRWWLGGALVSGNEGLEPRVWVKAQAPLSLAVAVWASQPLWILVSFVK